MTTSTHTTATLPIREYFCGTCQRSRHAVDVPDGWFALARHVTNHERHAKLMLGLYCSLECLQDQLERRATWTEGDAWRTSPRLLDRDPSFRVPMRGRA